MKKGFIILFIVTAFIYMPANVSIADELNPESVIFNINKGVTLAKEIFRAKEKFVKVRINFPLLAKFWPDIEKVSKKFSLDPLLIAATIKQESGFNPKARSYRNAIGLGKIIPPTARSIAKIYNINNYNLYNYKDNLMLMGAYLSHLTNLFTHPKYDDYLTVDGKQIKKTLVYTIASYNAGPGNAKRWTSIRETRKYVPKVLNFYRTYLKILGKTSSNINRNNFLN